MLLADRHQNCTADVIFDNYLGVKKIKFCTSYNLSLKNQKIGTLITVLHDTDEYIVVSVTPQ